MQDFGIKADDTAGPSGQLSAGEFNSLATELENGVLRSGQVLDGGSVLQIATAIFVNGVKADGFQDSGAANSYVATPISGASGVALPSSYAPLNGAMISFVASNTNSGASTLNIGQTTGTLLGAKAIKTQADVDIQANAIVAGHSVQLRFDSSFNSGAGAWVLMPWSFSSLATRGVVIFTSSGTWTVPSGVDQAFVTVIGGGGSGAFSNTGAGPSGGGGGGVAKKTVNLVGVSSVSITVGAGGASQTVLGTVGRDGGSSAFGAFCSATGGGGGGITGGASLAGNGVGGDINYTIGRGNVATLLPPVGSPVLAGGMGGGGESPIAVTDNVAPTQPGMGGGGRPSGAGSAPGAPGAVFIQY